MTEVPEDPAVPGAAQPTSAGAARHPANDNRRRRGEAAVDEWENEGGHFPSLPAAGIDPANVSPSPSAASESAGLAGMRADFESDFAAGLVGRHHNTYEHRTRVLRQLARGERDAAAAAASAPSPPSGDDARPDAGPLEPPPRPISPAG